MPLPDRIQTALHQVPPPPPGDPVAAIRRGRQRARRRQLRNGAGSLACVAALTVAAVVWWPDSPSGTPDIADQPDATCPVTEPDPGAFTPPDPYRTAEPGVEGGAWFGTADLWTVVSDPGAPRKSVWWSIHFDVSTEEQPDIEVVHERLDAPAAAPVVFEGPGTNAFTEEQGWFMIAGLQPDEPGCWRTTATYRDTELTITTLVEDDDAPTVLDLPAPDTVAAAFVDGHPVFVVRDADGEVRVLDAESPHLPRVLLWCETSRWFEDPWGSSYFDREGHWTGGPAPTGLAQYDVTVDQGGVEVGERRDPPERTSSSERIPAAGPLCDVRTALWRPGHTPDPTVLDDVVVHDSDGTDPDLWFPTPDRILGNVPTHPDPSDPDVSGRNG